MLLSIARYGYAAIPQDYKFLSRHAMLNIYYEILKSYTSGMSIPTKQTVPAAEA